MAGARGSQRKNQTSREFLWFIRHSLFTILRYDVANGTITQSTQKENIYDTNSLLHWFLNKIFTFGVHQHMIAHNARPHFGLVHPEPSSVTAMAMCHSVRADRIKHEPSQFEINRANRSIRIKYSGAKH